MLLVYENKDKGISAEWKKTVHMPPHLHEAIEVVYVTNGNIALGVGMELYNMDEGDFAIVFPNVIHHYQVFDEKENKAIFLYIDPAVLSGFLKELQIYSPKNPVLKKENVHPDVVHAIKFLMQNPECVPILAQAYAQIILAYVFTEIPMIDKKSLGSNDLIYNSGNTYAIPLFLYKIELGSSIHTEHVDKCMTCSTTEKMKCLYLILICNIVSGLY